MRRAELIVVGARQIGLAIAFNRLIYVYFCVSPENDSELGRYRKHLFSLGFTPTTAIESLMPSLHLICIR